MVRTRWPVTVQGLNVVQVNALIITSCAMVDKTVVMDRMKQMYVQVSLVAKALLNVTAANAFQIIRFVTVVQIVATDLTKWTVQPPHQPTT